jgi:hypothetical protein
MSVSFKKRSNISKNVRSMTNNGDASKDDKEEEVNIVKFETKIPQQKGLIMTTANLKRPHDEVDKVTTVFESTKEILPQQYAGDATHTSEIDTATDRDARALLERSIELNESGALDNKNVYLGQHAYKSYAKKDMSAVGANKFTGYALQNV